MDPDNERRKMIWEFFDAAETIKPKTFVMENVKALGELARWHKVREKYTNEKIGLDTIALRVYLMRRILVSRRKESVSFL